jgi:predicted ATP-dependent endonuclease of OLD family
MVLTEKLKINGDTSNVNYDINNVGQGMQTLITMLANILLKKPYIVLMDEPEVHMHPALIKEFIKYVKRLSTETQFIITTHSVVLMQEVGLDKIFTLKNDIDQKGIVISKVDDRNQLYETLNALGHNVDALTYTLKPSVFVFTEGPSDKDLILSFAEKAGLTSQINAFNTAFISLDGKGNRYKLANLIDKLNKEFIDSPLIMILDKDETAHTSIEDIREKFFSQNPKRLHYLSKRQIENYLIDRNAIDATVSAKIASAELLAKWKNEDLIDRISKLAEQQRKKILNNYLAELLINDSLINTKHLNEIVKSLSNKPLSKSIPEFTGEIFRLVGMRTSELGQKSNTAIQEFDNSWNTQKVEMSDGRELLKAIRRWVTDEYSVFFTNDELIQSMDAIPAEINALLTQLTKPQELKINQ